MVSLKKILYYFQYVFIAVQFVLAIIASVKASAVYFILAIAFAFLYIAVMPTCKYNENTWMFFMVAITVTPVNIRIIIYALSGSAILFFSVVFGVILFFIMLSIEELIVGIITRLVWKNQREFDDYEQLNS